jgi:hypothetical protein
LHGFEAVLSIYRQASWALCKVSYKRCLKFRANVITGYRREAFETLPEKYLVEILSLLSQLIEGLIGQWIYRRSDSNIEHKHPFALQPQRGGCATGASTNNDNIP